jgi:glutamate formiminotransferase
MREPSVLVECVPNFSEGRRLAVIDEIDRSIREVPGVLRLDRHSDPDHNRTVITFAGAPEGVLEAAVRSAGEAARLIDLREHRGVHPRLGALDVLPFAPLEGTTIEECAALAVRAAREIWRRWRVPAYLYGAAALKPDRRDLAHVRRGQFEALREEALRDPERAPDIGGPGLHPAAGAVAAGARKVLVAFNVQLSTADVEIARRIARRIRESSGGLPCVKAMGVPLASRGMAQVSMNLTDYEITPPHRVFLAIREEAGRLGVSIADSEIVGLVPQVALGRAAWAELGLRTPPEDRILERRLDQERARLRDRMK